MNKWYMEYEKHSIAKKNMSYCVLDDEELVKLCQDNVDVQNIFSKYF